MKQSSVNSPVDTIAESLPESLRAGFIALPRIPLGNWPTPLEHCPHLAHAIGASQLWVKRDDQSGPALGGNKVRQLEYTLADAIAQGCQGVLIAIGEQSNHARQLAALARKVGLLPVIIINKAAPPPVLRGNLLLVALTGADIRYLAAADYEKEMDAHCDAVVAEYAARGLKLYRVRPDRSQMLGAAAGLRSLLELKQQVDSLGIQPSSITVSAASGSQAGMVLACHAIGWDIEVRGVAPVIWREPLHARSARFANQLAEQMQWPIRLAPTDIINDLTHVGAGYQQPTPASMHAVRLAAETEGIFLDPNYTGKALAALIDDLASGAIDRTRPVIFWHTGGVPALFSADQEITEYLHAHSSARA